MQKAVGGEVRPDNLLKVPEGWFVGLPAFGQVDNRPGVSPA